MMDGVAGAGQEEWVQVQSARAAKTHKRAAVADTCNRRARGLVLPGMLQGAFVLSGDSATRRQFRIRLGKCRQYKQRSVACGQQKNCQQAPHGLIVLAFCSELLSLCVRIAQRNRSRQMLTFILWCLLLLFSWPLAIAALILYPIVWVILLPFRLLGIAVHGVLALVAAVIFLPVRAIRAIV
jgi:hypothetical protein